MYRISFDACRLQFEPYPVLCLHLDSASRQTAESLVDELSTHNGKVYDCDIKQHRERRSLDANAYFHVLVGKIAEKMNLGFEEVKTKLVLEYGTVARGEDGKAVGVKLPKTVNITDFYRYAKWFGESEEKGVEFNHYMMFKETHLLDTKEMSKLIDGTVHDAKELGIQTETPEELAKMKSLWGVSK